MRTPAEMTCGFLIPLVFCKKKTMWFIGVEVEQETSAPLPKKNPGSAPVNGPRISQSVNRETRTRFNLEFFRVFSKNIHLGKLHCSFIEGGLFPLSIAW